MTSMFDDRNLPARLMFHDRLATALATAAERKGTVGLLALQTHHGAAAVAKTDDVVRLADDRQMVLLKTAERLAQAEALAAVPGVKAAGLAVYPQDAGHPDSLWRAASEAAERAKVEGRRLQRARSDIREIPPVLEMDRFLLHYQSQVAVADRRMVGVEALVRMEHPTRGLISPGEIILMAERVNGLAALGEWALRRACEEVSAMRASFAIPFTVAVNLSLTQFAEAHAVERLLGIIAESGLAPGDVEFELTETSPAISLSAVAGRLQHLRQQGVTLALDDFGTGFASLTLLRRLPLDLVKIDRRYVHGIDRDERERDGLAAILGLIRDLGLKSLAEGVEREAQYAILRRLGCDFAQGYLFGRPLPADSAGQ